MSTREWHGSPTRGAIAGLWKSSGVQHRPCGTGQTGGLRWSDLLTPFFGTCQYVERAAGGVGQHQNKERAGMNWALWARKCVAADGAEEEANEAMLASYLLGFI